MSSDPAPAAGRGGAAADAGITRTFGWQDVSVPPGEDPAARAVTRPASGTP